MPANRRFRRVVRIGPVQVATYYDGRSREKHTAACTAPRCGFATDYDSGAAAELAARTHHRLRAWAHMFGFRSHFSTKSRRYSTTLGALREARADWRRAQAAPPVSQDGETALVLAHWIFAGTGLSSAEAWLSESLEPAPGTEGEPTWTPAATN